MHILSSAGVTLFGMATSSRRINNVVQVWDGCFNQLACEKLHQTASQVGLSHKIFHRNDDDTRKLSQLEHALDSALTELGDDSNVVEYW